MRGETFNEIFSFVKILRNKMDKISLRGDLMDTCGTGGDKKIVLIFLLQPHLHYLHVM